MGATRMAVTQDPVVQLDAMSALFRHSGGEPETHEMLTGLAVFIARLEEAHSVTAAHVEAAIRMAAETSEDDPANGPEADGSPAGAGEPAGQAGYEPWYASAGPPPPQGVDEPTVILAGTRRPVRAAVVRPATALAAFALMAAIGGAGWMAFSDGAEQLGASHSMARLPQLASRGVAAAPAPGVLAAPAPGVLAAPAPGVVAAPAPVAVAMPAPMMPAPVMPAAVAVAVPVAPPPPVVAETVSSPVPAAATAPPLAAPPVISPGTASPPQLAAAGPAEAHETEGLQPELSKPDMRQAETAPAPLPVPPVPPLKQADAVAVDRAPPGAALPLPPPIPVEAMALPPHAPAAVGGTPVARPRYSAPNYLRHAERDYRVSPHEAPPAAEATPPVASTAYSALVDELRRNAIALGRPVPAAPRQDLAAVPTVSAPVAAPVAAPVPPPQHFVGSYIMGPDGRRIFVTSP